MRHFKKPIEGYVERPNSNSIVNVYQSGFRPGHSIFSAAMLDLKDVLNCLDHRNHCVALFTDLPKAFDTVDHPLLIQRLSEMARCLASGLGAVRKGHCVLSDGVKSISLKVSCRG
jgi:hypothetical protein